MSSTEYFSIREIVDSSPNLAEGIDLVESAGDKDLLDVFSMTLIQSLATLPTDEDELLEELEKLRWLFANQTEKLGKLTLGEAVTIFLTSLLSTIPLDILGKIISSVQIVKTCVYCDETCPPELVRKIEKLKGVSILPENERIVSRFFIISRNEGRDVLNPDNVDVIEILTSSKREDYSINLGIENASFLIDLSAGRLTDPSISEFSETSRTLSPQSVEVEGLLNFLEEEGFGEELATIVSGKDVSQGKFYYPKNALETIDREYIVKSEDIEDDEEYIELESKSVELTTVIVYITNWGVEFSRDNVEMLSTIRRYFTGTLLTDKSLYSYGIVALDFVNEKLADVYELPEILYTKEIQEGIVEKCIIPCIPAAKLVKLEHLTSMRVLSQYVTLLKNPERMRHIGKGNTLTDAEIADNLLTSRSESTLKEVDYYDWLLTSSDETELYAYVSIRPYQTNKQIRVIARVEGKGYARRAVLLAMADFLSRSNETQVDARVSRTNLRSIALFNSIGWVVSSSKYDLIYTSPALQPSWKAM